jgi:aminoglycoside 6'-N-acetyltransferase I
LPGGYGRTSLKRRMGLRIIDLVASQEAYVEQAGDLVWWAFQGRSSAWPTNCAARQEVLDSLSPEKVSRVMVNDAQGVVGWIGAMPQYDGHVWELHPLVVAEPWRRRGIGRALVSDLERVVASRGALTLWLGSDDENHETSLGGVNLYEDLPGKLREVRAWGEHPLGFYLRLGFRIVGVMPDANGRGRPDIFLAKRIG